jgi:hypothetical protein
MNKQKYTRYWAFLIMAIVAITVFIFPGTVTANAQSSGISINPFESIIMNVTPGQTLTHRMTITIGDDAKAIDMTVDPMGYGFVNGSPKALPAAQDTSPYSARTYISLDQNNFHLEPGVSQTVTATITIPQDVGPGGRYAIIYFHQQIPVDQSGAGSITSINIPVLLTIQDSKILNTAKISGIAFAKGSYQEIDIFTVFENTGNHHFKPKCTVAISDPGNNILTTIETPLIPASIIPKSSTQIMAAFGPQTPLAPGVYTVQSKLMLEDGTLLDTADGSFTIGLAGLVVPTSTTATQGSASSGSTTDGASFSGGKIPTGTVSELTETNSTNWLAIISAASGVVIIGLVLVLIIILRRRSIK